MFSEKLMEDAIAQNPQKYIDESGLKLLARQYRIGNYIFDLLFVDKYGAKLIVELQKGTLDRAHTYKILDYYDEYKEQNPHEFIELMVIANRVPLERKKRLKFWGITFKEIPENEFLGLEDVPTKRIKKEDETENDSKRSISKGQSNSPDRSYRLFKRQKKLFMKELRRYDPDIQILVNWDELSELNIAKRKNWFVCFVPKQWGKPKEGFGIHFGFVYMKDRNSSSEFVRLTVGAEKPLDPHFNGQFKGEVIAELQKVEIDLTNLELYPNAGIRKGTKLIEINPVPLDENSYKRVINEYKNLSEVIGVISAKIEEYHNKDRFMGKLELLS